jgi:hypothetical protein
LEAVEYFRVTNKGIAAELELLFFLKCQNHVNELINQYPECTEPKVSDNLLT